VGVGILLRARARARVRARARARARLRIEPGLALWCHRLAAIARVRVAEVVQRSQRVVLRVDHLRCTGDAREMHGVAASNTGRS